ncbi:ECF transporter S component [Gardnerella sp. 2492-Sm]|uniref:ECF transporter S component n=1 Tax=unclassified Gardnerella TaxID=2628112 RepID=UPI003D030034
MSEELKEKAKINWRWTVADITVTVVIGVASGVIFWIGYFTHHFLDIPFAAVPGLNCLYYGLFYFPACLAAIIVRKPGAAFLGEFVAALTEFLIGTSWGATGVLIPGLVQGIFGEIIFLCFLYRVWNVWVATLDGAFTAFGGTVISYILWGEGASIFSDYMIISTISGLISGAIISGLLMWYLYKAICLTGALDRFASGRVARA